MARAQPVQSIPVLSLLEYMKDDKLADFRNCKENEITDYFKDFTKYGLFINMTLTDHPHFVLSFVSVHGPKCRMPLIALVRDFPKREPMKIFTF